MDLKKWTIFRLLDADVIAKIKLACVFGNHGNEVLVVTHDDDVLSFGSNVSGCLGLGNVEATLRPRRVDALCGKGVVNLAYGSGPHVLALTSAGEVYSWGHNSYCELGHTWQACVPMEVHASLAGKQVVEIACGSHHSLVLTCDGEVYAWGQNTCGQVGSGLSANQGTPRRVNSVISSRHCVSIACGQASSMAITVSGELFTWGYNGSGQLGVGNTVNQVTPGLVSGLSGVHVRKVVCGYGHAMALTDVGGLYTWGANSYGQLGTSTKANSSIPVLVSCDMGRIVDIAASHYSHTCAAMTQTCKVYMWGQCRGQSVVTPMLTTVTSLNDVFACFSSPAVTCSSLAVSNEESNTIVDSLRDAFNNEEHSDLTIVVDDRTIHVHKAVLRIRCHHFRSMFQGHWKEGGQSVLHLDQFPYQVYHSFLRYLYTGELNVSLEDAVDLLVLASAYCEMALKQRCEEVIKRGITVDNAAMLYSTAIQYQAKELEEFCFHFFVQHLTAVVHTDAFNSLDDGVVKAFMRRAADCGAFRT